MIASAERAIVEMSAPINIFISAGEASGEHYGALLTAALQRRLAGAGQPVRFFGMGGARMAAEGLETVVRSEDVAVMGLTEVIRHLPRIYGEFQKLKRAIRIRRPAVAVLIDSPEIHLRLAKLFHRLGVPVIYFVSPQLWAWKKHRIRLVQKYVRRMLVIFPFEEPFYRQRGVPAEFVGHPLAELPPPTITRAQFASEHSLDPAKLWIGLLPGSRAKEIAAHLPELLDAARAFDRLAVAAAQEKYQFIVPLAPTLHEEQRLAVQRLADRLAGALTLRFTSDARATLLHARASVVASGTATVEAALIGNPFVVIYRVSSLTYAMARKMVKVPHVAMVNLIAGRRVVPELIQNDFRASNIVQHLGRLLPDGPDRQSMMIELAAVQDALRAHPANCGSQGGNAIERVSQIVLEELDTASPAARMATLPCNHL